MRAIGDNSTEIAKIVYLLYEVLLTEIKRSYCCLF